MRTPSGGHRARGGGRMERRSTGAQTVADGAPGQRDAGCVVGTASSVGQHEKPAKML